MITRRKCLDGAAAHPVGADPEHGTQEDQGQSPGSQTRI